MIPFQHTWPYDRIGQDIYVPSCPFCRTAHVMIPLKPKHLEALQSGVKKLIVFPCCHSRLMLVEADQDYLLADQPLARHE